MPADKARELERMKDDGAVVGFVGDGINDAVALAAADLGIAIGTGTDVAVETGDVVLMSGDPRGVPTALALARGTYRVIVSNLVWAFVVQRCGHPPGGVRRPRPDDRRGGDGVFQRLGGDQLVATAPVQAGYCTLNDQVNPPTSGSP